LAIDYLLNYKTIQQKATTEQKKEPVIDSKDEALAAELQKVLNEVEEQKAKAKRFVIIL
jgi:hypothetical protein